MSTDDCRRCEGSDLLPRLFSASSLSWSEGRRGWNAVRRYLRPFYVVTSGKCCREVAAVFVGASVQRPELHGSSLRRRRVRRCLVAAILLARRCRRHCRAPSGQRGYRVSLMCCDCGLTDSFLPSFFSSIHPSRRYRCIYFIAALLFIVK